MDVTFYGHQTWGVSVGDTSILFDPLLKPYFGASSESFCAIYPFREVSMTRSIEAIFLSHEHGDHFCIETLHQIDRNVPVYTGVLMPRNIDKCLQSLGFKVRKFESGSVINLESGATVTPLHCAKETPFWERRVYQFLVRHEDDSFYLAVDGGVSSNTIMEFKEGNLPIPSLFAVSNNAQITSIDRKGAFENRHLAADLDPDKNGLVGISVYAGLMSECLPESSVPHIAVCGGGFIKGKEDMDVHPFSEHWAVAAHIASHTSDNISAPKPGTRYILSQGNVVDITTSTDVSLLTKENFLTKYVNKIDNDIKRTGYYPLSQKKVETCKSMYGGEIGNTISEFLNFFQLSNEGREFYLEALRLRLPATISFSLDGAPEKLTWHKNLKNGELIHSSDNASSTISINVFTQDFLHLINGEIDIWELSGSHISIGHPPTMQNFAITFIYSYFGEQVSQNLAMNFFEKKMRKTQEKNYAN